jgi:ABC-type uncharacterized transport system substrate-binding protein
MLPAVYALREFAVVGGLMSYGSSFSDTYHQVAVYTDQILKGAKPSDLPVTQLTKIQLVINVKTAKTLGITFPLSWTAIELAADLGRTGTSSVKSMPTSRLVMSGPP